MKKTAISLSILMSLLTSAYASGFYVYNSLPSHYVHLGPNGGPSDISMQSNPDGDSWYLDGAFANKGGHAYYGVESPDNFAKTSTTTQAPSYGNYTYNSEANLIIYIYDSENQIVTTCPISHAYYQHESNGDDRIAIAGDTQYCNNPNYYVQDDQSHGVFMSIN